MGRTYQAAAAPAPLRRALIVGRFLCSPPPVTQIAGICVSLPAVRAEFCAPRGSGSGDPMQPRGCGGESPLLWRSVDRYASPTANPVGAQKENEKGRLACRDARVILLFSSTGTTRSSAPVLVVPARAAGVGTPPPPHRRPSPHRYP